MPRDFYEVLGLSRGASADDVKKAYRKLSKELHPDKHKGDKEAEKKFKEVNEAYETLNNPQKKQAYDQFGHAGANAGGGFGGGQGFGGFDFSNFTQGDMGGFADLFSDFFGGAQTRPRDERGSDREADVTINLSDVFTGIRREFRFRRLNACKTCHGDGAAPGSKVITCAECSGTGQVTRVTQSFLGRIQQRMVCPVCKGSGKIPEQTCKTCSGEGRTADDVTVAADIPAGIHDGQTLRLRGEGDAGRQGAQAGDLYVHVHVSEDPRFVRDNDDIRSETTVHVVDAILGSRKEIPTLHGMTTIKIDAGTQPGQVMRLKGKGLPIMGSSRHGDHYVTVNVEIPKKLSREEKKLMEEWKQL